jgi:hypothetical protein
MNEICCWHKYKLPALGQKYNFYRRFSITGEVQGNAPARQQIKVGQVNGYRLFEICTLGEGKDAAAHGVLKMRAETNFCLMRTSGFMEMGGFNERFIQLGGGFANFDFFRRATEAAREGFVMLLGEGAFHQVHCGATTQAGGVDRKYDGDLSLSARV